MSLWSTLRRHTRDDLRRKQRKALGKAVLETLESRQMVTGPVALGAGGLMLASPTQDWLTQLKMSWFSVNWRMSAGALDTRGDGNVRFLRDGGMLGMIGGIAKGEGGIRMQSEPPSTIIRRTPGRLFLASWTPPELACASPVKLIM